MKTMIFGSCRVMRPCEDMNNLIRHNVGLMTSLSQMIQAVKIMRGELSIPANLEKYVFQNPWGENKKLDISEVEMLVVEVSTVRSRYCEIKGQRIYLVPSPDIDMLHEVVDFFCFKEQLSCLCNYFPNAKILLVPIHRGDNRAVITLGIYNVSVRNNYDFFEPHSIIKEFGVGKCMLTRNHYTDFMYDRIRERVVGSIESHSSSSSLS